MKKHCFATCLIISGVALNACSKNSCEMWIATDKVSVYSAPIDGNENVIFELESGETCIKTRETMQKVFLHTELLCKKGKGWVVDLQKFTVLKNDETK
jgi:hypothetical protein